MTNTTSPSTSSLLSLNGNFSNTGATKAVVEVVDWFDTKIANLFHKKSNTKLTETAPKVPVLGIEILAAYAGSFLPKKDKVVEIAAKNIIQNQSTLTAVKSTEINRNKIGNKNENENGNEKEVAQPTDSGTESTQFKLSEQIESAAQVMKTKINKYDVFSIVYSFCTILLSYKNEFLFYDSIILISNFRQPSLLIKKISFMIYTQFYHLTSYWLCLSFFFTFSLHLVFLSLSPSFSLPVLFYFLSPCLSVYLFMSLFVEIFLSLRLLISI